MADVALIKEMGRRLRTAKENDDADAVGDVTIELALMLLTELHLCRVALERIATKDPAGQK